MPQESRAASRHQRSAPPRVPPCVFGRTWGEGRCRTAVRRQPVPRLRLSLAGSNLLINNQGQLKLADFGLARPFDDTGRSLTNRVITLWYRPPELLLGSQNYGPAVDMWSVGCIFAELLLKRPILPGKNELQQIDKIFKMFGTPTEQTWPGLTKLHYYQMVATQCGTQPYPNRFAEQFGMCALARPAPRVSHNPCPPATRRPALSRGVNANFYLKPGWTKRRKSCWRRC